MDQNQSIEHQMTSEINKDVFTTNGVYVGTVCDITLDVDGEKATRLAVNNVNSELFGALPKGRGVLIPYRWVRATADVVLVADIVERIVPEEGQKEEREYRTVREANEEAAEQTEPETPTEEPVRNQAD